MLAVLILLNLLIIPLIIDGINIPLFKDTEDDICKFEDDLCGHGSDGSNGSDGDNRTSSKGRRHRRTHGIKKNRYLYLLDHAAVQF
jgi:hypothetical protein